MKVRLDHCEERDGVIWFDNAPLNGIGVDVDDTVVLWGLGAGQVRMWRYEHGLRVEPWVPPGSADLRRLGGDVMMIDSNGEVRVEEGTETRVVFDDEPLTGWTVIFNGPHLVNVHAHRDGYLERDCVVWHLDGSLEHITTVGYVEISDGGLVAVNQLDWWREGVCEAAGEATPHRSELELRVGELYEQPENYGGFPVARPRFGAKGATPGPYYSRLRIGRDPDGQVTELELMNHHHFDLIKTYGAVNDSTSSLPQNWNELAALGASSELVFLVPSSAFDAVIEGLGGFNWFTPVHHLKTRSRLEPAQLAQFFRLPNLTNLNYQTLRSKDADQTQRFIELANEATRRRPDLQIQPIKPGS